MGVKQYKGDQMMIEILILQKSKNSDSKLSKV